MNQETLKAYYDYTLPLYRMFWHGDTRAIHYGMWDASTHTLKDALLNTNKVLAERVGVQSNERVLDAGCGVGGSAFWLARNRGARVVGITLSEKQYQKAWELTSRYELADKVEFFLEDYTKTHFPDASFDIVWAIESVCHAADKLVFLKEAQRLLKAGGRVVVADGFVEREPRNTTETKQLESFLKGFAVEDLARSGRFEELMREAGFKDVQSWDETRTILPTARSMARMSRWSLPLSRLTTSLKLTPPLLVHNNRAGIDQEYLFKNGVLAYRIFVGHKA